MKAFIYRCGLFAGLLAIALLLIGLVTPYNKDSFNRAYFTKRAQLDRERQQAFILVGGSNVAFGFDSSLIEDSLRKPVINNGVFAGFGLKFMLDDIARHTIPGDTLIIMPEYEHFFGQVAYGDQGLTDIFYLDPTISNTFDRHQLITVLHNTAPFLKSKIEYTLAQTIMPDRQTVYALSSFNDHGDVVRHWNDQGIGYQHIPRGGVQPNVEFIDYYTAWTKRMQERGVAALLFPPGIAETSYQHIQPRIDTLTTLLRNRGVEFYAPTASYAFADSLFYDTPMHLGRAGAVMRSLQLANDLKTIRNHATNDL